MLAGVHFLVHGEGSVLAVAQVVGGVGLVHTVADVFLVVGAGEYILAFLAVHDGGAGVLAEGQLALGGHLGIAKHGQSHELVVLAGFGVG